MVKLHIRVLLSHLQDGLPPQPGGLQDIGLVNIGNLFAPLPGHVKGHPGDALDLGDGVHLGIEGGGLAVYFLAAPLSEVDAAGQLSDHHDVHGVADDLVLDGGSRL